MSDEDVIDIDAVAWSVVRALYGIGSALADAATDAGTPAAFAARQPGMWGGERSRVLVMVTALEACGFAVVPIEATDEMVVAAENVGQHRSVRDWIRQAWGRAVAARPRPAPRVATALSPETRLDDLEMSTRLRNCFRNLGCQTVADALAYSCDDNPYDQMSLSRVPNLGKGSLAEWRRIIGADRSGVTP